MDKKPQDIEKYQAEYSEKGLWDKIKREAASAGEKIVYNALLLYYTAQSPQTPAKHKAAIYGALGYFILPTDIIPDILPGVGYTDDLTAILSVVALVSINLTEQVKEQAKTKLERWFGKG